MVSEGFFHRPSSSILSSYCFFPHTSQPHLKKSISLMFAMPLLELVRDSCSASTPFFAVLACFEDRSGCSCVSSEGLNEIVCDESLQVTVRNSFAVSSKRISFRFSFLVNCVGSDISSSCSSSSSPSFAFRDGSETAGLIGARSSMKPCGLRVVANPTNPLTCKDANDQRQHRRARNRRSPTCAWLRFTEAVPVLSKLSIWTNAHCSPCSPARASLQYETISPPTTGVAFCKAARLTRSPQSHRTNAARAFAR